MGRPGSAEARGSCMTNDALLTLYILGVGGRGGGRALVLISPLHTPSCGMTRGGITYVGVACLGAGRGPPSRGTKYTVPR